MANHTKMSCKAKGGRVAYAGASSHVAKEVAEKKFGGAVKAGGGAVPGKASGGRISKARGGGVSSTKSPFSSAGGGGASKHPFSSAHRR